MHSVNGFSICGAWAVFVFGCCSFAMARKESGLNAGSRSFPERESTTVFDSDTDKVLELETTEDDFVRLLVHVLVPVMETQLGLPNSGKTGKQTFVAPRNTLGWGIIHRTSGTRVRDTQLIRRTTLTLSCDRVAFGLP